MSALKKVVLESGGCIYTGFEGNLFLFTAADRKLLSTIADAIQEHEGYMKTLPKLPDALAADVIGAEVVQKDAK